MGRQNFGDGQEIVLSDLNNISKAIETQLYDRYLKELVQGKVDAFFGDGLKVAYASSDSVTVAAGLGIQEDTDAVAPEPTMRPMYLSDVQNLDLTDPPHASLNRIDIVLAKNMIANSVTETRNFKDAISDVISEQSLVIRKDWLADLSILSGTAGVSPVAPSTPDGYIKIAELLVTAVTGMSGAGAVTDTRELMPVGGESLLNTIGYQRLTAGSAEALSDLMAEVDAFLKNGYQQYTDFDDLVADPSAPGASKQRAYFKNGVAYFRAPGGTITPLGSGGGGGGGLVWNPVEGSEPLPSKENSNQVYLFDTSQTEQLSVWLKVPASYLAGRQIKMKIGVYSPGTSGNILMRSVATLIRQNNDAVSSTTNQRTSTNTQITNTVANRYREIELDLTSSTGTINSVAVSAGDLIKVVLDRNFASESSPDSNDVRFMPTSTEVTFT